MLFPTELTYDSADIKHTSWKRSSARVFIGINMCRACTCMPSHNPKTVNLNVVLQKRSPQAAETAPGICKTPLFRTIRPSFGLPHVRRPASSAQVPGRAEPPPGDPGGLRQAGPAQRGEAARAEPHGPAGRESVGNRLAAWPPTFFSFFLLRAVWRRQRERERPAFEQLYGLQVRSVDMEDTAERTAIPR